MYISPGGATEIHVNS